MTLGGTDPRVVPMERASEVEVLETLSWLGAPLSCCRPARRLPAEEAVLEALRLSHEDATVLRSLPLVLTKSLRGNLDWERLMSAVEAGETGRRELGFVLEVAAALSSAEASGTLRDYAGRLHHPGDADRRDYFFGKRGPREQRLAEENTPPEARHWGFVLNMPRDSFQQLFEKHAGTEVRG